MFLRLWFVLVLCAVSWYRVQGQVQTNKWSVSSQWSFNTQWKPGQQPTTQIKVTQNGSPGAPDPLSSVFANANIPSIDSLVNQAIQSANQQAQQFNFQGQTPANQMHTFIIQTPQTGNQVQTISIPWQQGVQQGNFLPQQTTNQLPQANFQPPQLINQPQGGTSNIPWQRPVEPQRPNQVPQTNNPPPNIPWKKPIEPPLILNQNQPSNIPWRKPVEAPQSAPPVLKVNPQQQQGNNAEDEDDRPTWGAPPPTNPDRLQLQRPSETSTTTLPPPVIMKSNTSSLTFIIRDREFPPEVIPAASYVKDSVSLRYCLSYCNIRFLQYGGEIAVVGGENARLNEFPHMVTLGFSSGLFQGKPVISWNSCGGSLISRNFVLTAAHCMFSDRGKPSLVRVGEHDLSTNEDGAQPQDLNILDIIVHPDYNTLVSEYNDIALIKLEGHVVFTKYMRPACLHTGIASVEDTERPWRPIATGWGLVGFTDFPSDILQKVELDIIDNSTCKNLLNTNEYIPNGVNDETQLCAGVLSGGRDTCVGDSGGPLQVNNTVFHWLRECPMDIVGVTSFGSQCAQESSPGIYTRVKHFVPWIESIVWPGE